MKLESYLKNTDEGEIVGASVYCGNSTGKASFICACGVAFEKSLLTNFRGLEFFTCRQCSADRRKNDDWGFRAVFRRMKFDSARRGIEFHLTLDHLKSMILEPCHYCMVEGMNAITYKSKVGATEEFRYNGLDRIDSSGHYTIDNVLPSCPICNRAKGSSSYSEFMAWIIRITNCPRVGV